MIKVGIIEDDNFVRNELVSLLNESTKIQPVIFSETAENFLKYCNVHNELDFILIDIGLPGMSGIEVMPKLKTKFPQIELVVLTSFKDNDTIFRALRAGATGYILKDSGLEQIEEILINIGKGIPALSPVIARRMVDFFQVHKVDLKDVELTSKEFQVLKHLVDGLSYKLIADQLNVSINTIRYHIKNIYKKLHINSRPELMKLYMDGEINFQS